MQSNIYSRLYTGTAVVLLCLHVPQVAQAQEDAAWQQKVSALEKKIEKLENQLDALSRERMTPSVFPAGIGAKVIAGLSPGPVIFSAPEPWRKWKMTGRFQYDAAFFSDDKKDHFDGTELRRARLGVQGGITEDFSYKFEVDLADDEVNVTDAYIAFGRSSRHSALFGQFKEPLGLEALDSAIHTLFIERSTVMAFAPFRNMGMMAKYVADKGTVSMGIFGDDIGDSREDDTQYAVTARITHTPLHEEKGNVMHVGASASYRKPEQNNDTVRYSVRPETGLSDVVVDTGVITDVDYVVLAGLEAAANIGALFVQGEYIRSDIARAGAPDVVFDGYYAEAAWMLTGEKHTYERGSAVFGRVVPDNPLKRNGKGWGAWEVAARYSSLNLSNKDIRGGEVETYTLGLNWYASDRIRFMANYIWADSNRDAVVPDDDPNIFTVRAQVDF